MSAALIHNHYPSVAEKIRAAQGRTSRARRDVKIQELCAEQLKSRRLRQEMDELRGQVRKLTSINEGLLAENTALKAMRNAKVIDLPSRRGRKGGAC